MRCLDLDDPSTYRDIFSRACCEDAVLLKLIYDYNNSREIYNQLSSDSEYISGAFVIDLQNQFMKILLNEYSHVAYGLKDSFFFPA